MYQNGQLSGMPATILVLYDDTTETTKIKIKIKLQIEMQIEIKMPLQLQIHIEMQNRNTDENGNVITNTNPSSSGNIVSPWRPHNSAGIASRNSRPADELGASHKMKEEEIQISNIELLGWDGSLIHKGSRETGQTDLTFKLDFPGNLCRAAFAILAMF